MKYTKWKMTSEIVSVVTNYLFIIYEVIRKIKKGQKSFFMLTTVSTFHWVVSLSICFSSSPYFFHWFTCHTLLCENQSENKFTWYIIS